MKDLTTPLSLTERKQMSLVNKASMRNAQRLEIWFYNHYRYVENLHSH